MDTLIRVARIDDLEDIVRIYNQAVDHRATADLDHLAVADRVSWFHDHTPDEYPIYVSVVQDTVFGWISVSPHRPGRRALRATAEVSYYIDYQHHARGLGSQLLSRVMEECPTLGIENIFAILLADNASSIGLLKKFQFELWGRLPNVARIDGRTVSQVFYGRHV